MIGRYNYISTLPAYDVVFANWQSQNYRTGSGYLTNDSGGAYKGYLNTQILLYSQFTMSTDALALYADASGNIGILRGNIPGSVYLDAYGFKAEGPINRIELATGTVIAASTFIADGTTGGAFKLNTSGAPYNNLLSGGPALVVTGLDSQWLSFANSNYSNLGLGRNMLSGTYSTVPSPYTPLGNAVFSYYRQVGSGANPIVGSESFVYTQIDASSAWTSGLGGYFQGNIAGAASDWTSATTSVFGGTVKGTFSPVVTNAGTWYATALSTVIETAKFVDMANPDIDVTGSNRAKLAALNIPSAIVGSVDLSFTRNTSTDDYLNVNMTGVNFYAYSAGQTPKIIATKSVSGTYSVYTGSIPAPATTTAAASGTNVTVQSGANFTPVVWNTSSPAQWVAKISGGGTITPSGTGTPTTISFGGAAAGAITTATTVGGYTKGSFTGGTASGVVVTGTTLHPN
ncbi:MAG: hypothetical protein CVU52_08185 [Deltaproteobacteria bacterium HGW-Deltaproteobacteria-10]|nr:MAG: hypothetical protein CVU52_08185 [Deltaproteobacteria bacterium HGW-Deltaproteobacteria-10]